MSGVSTRLVVGCGYLGLRAARAWLEGGDRVFATTRSAQRAGELRSLGLESVVADVTRPDSLNDLPAVDTLLFAVSWDRSSDTSRREVVVDGVRNVARRLAGTGTRMIHVSSASVYGQSDGEWVDEDTPCEPARENGQVQLDAERGLRDLLPDAIVLRLAGIYGPGRLLRRVESLRAREPLAGRPDAWLNLIHVDDAVRAVLAAAGCGEPGATYVVSDDEPVRREHYFTRLAAACDAPPPVFDESLPTRHTAGGLNKRLSNRKLREELGVELAFPTIEAGLPHAVAGS